DAGVELRLQSRVKLVARGDGPMADGRRDQRGARSCRPVKLAPGKRPPESRSRPRTDIQEAVEGAMDPLGGDGPVARDDEERIVAHRGVLPERVCRDEDEISTAQGQALRAWLRGTPRGPAGHEAASARPRRLARSSSCV